MKPTPSKMFVWRKSLIFAAAGFVLVAADPVSIAYAQRPRPSPSPGPSPSPSPSHAP